MTTQQMLKEFLEAEEAGIIYDLHTYAACDTDHLGISCSECPADYTCRYLSTILPEQSNPDSASFHSNFDKLIRPYLDTSLTDLKQEYPELFI